jgi:glycosyltransferase involved in cell wall biosynthesis
VSGIRGVRYYGAGDISGYGQAAIANVRALVNAGVPVHWIPLEWAPDRMRAAQWTLPDGRVRRLLTQLGERGHLADVGTLIERTSAPIDCDTVIAHAPPEFWPYAFEAGKRNIGCTAWETDRTPAHWLPLMRLAQRIVVPSLHNHDALRRSGVQNPIDIIPHIRRHRWCEFTPSDLAAARDDLGIAPDHRVLYTINAWDPRKALGDVIMAFAKAFSSDDAVTLVIKTRRMGSAAGPLYDDVPTRELAQRATQAAVAATGRNPPPIVLHDEELDGDDLDLFHAIGDIYVSMSHGEGWGLGAFEAATLGKPVVMPAWGGQSDFLGTQWPGAVPFGMTPVPLWPPTRPSYYPSQRWAQPDIDAAAALLRAHVHDGKAALSAAANMRERITQQFAEPIVIDQWLRALDA